MAYTNVNSRQQLVDYCLRRLGFPVIDINVADEQISDRIDDALQMYLEYHSEGSIRTYFRVQITQDMLDNGFIDFATVESLQANNFATRILNVVRVLPIGSESSSVNFFFIFSYILRSVITKYFGLYFIICFLRFVKTYLLALVF